MEPPIASINAAVINSRMEEPPGQDIVDVFDMGPLHSALKTPIPKTKMHISLLSASTMRPFTPFEWLTYASNELTPSTPMSSVIHECSEAPPSPENYAGYINWASVQAEKMEDRDQAPKLILFAFSRADLAAVNAPEDIDVSKKGKLYLSWAHSTSTMADEPKRKFLKWPHSTSTMTAPPPVECKRWSLEEEISKPFEIALGRLQEEIKQYETALGRDHLEEDEDSYTDITQEHMIYSCQKGMTGVYRCENALWIWPKIRNSCSITLNFLNRPRAVGKKIMEKLPESDMIKGKPSINDLGVVSIELSGEWIAKSIQKMLKDGIDTWAPKLPVEGVMLDFLHETHGDSFRGCAIGLTLKTILEYCKVDVAINHYRSMITRLKRRRVNRVLDHWFAREDTLDLCYGLDTVDWIVYLAPVWKQEYIEMSFKAAKRHKSSTSNRLKPARTTCAGYRSCTNELEEFLDIAKTHVAVEEGEDAKLLEYTAVNVLDCVFIYTCLKNHRLTEFNIKDEMLQKEGNTFVHLLSTQAKIRRIMEGKDINELKKASLGKDEGWEKAEWRMLGIKLLEFTEVLEESCLSVSPHILCEYLYDLSKKFNSYYSLCEVGHILETSTLLLCEATAVVIEKCFHLLRITPASSRSLPFWSLLSNVGRTINLNTWVPPRNSRFELFSFLNDTETLIDVDVNDLFGVISVSSDGDLAHVPLFNHDWINPVKPTKRLPVYLGSNHSVRFCSSIEIAMELYVRKNKKACYQLCNHMIEIDLSDFVGDKKLESASGALTVSTLDGRTTLFYVLLKDAIDAALEIKFETKTAGRRVRGYILAHYGYDFLSECRCPTPYKYNYMALLFRPNHVLKDGKIKLIKSLLAVPPKGSLVIKAYLEDARSGEVIVKSSYQFMSQLSSHSVGKIEGINCCFDLKVDWNYA